MKMVLLSLLVAAPLTAVPAAASDNATAQKAAVSTLENYTRVAPSDGGAYVELAQAYLRDNRPAEAAAAYRRVLQLDNVMMLTPNGDSIWSHEVARNALARIPQLTAR